jgi:hypothetical protein
LPAPRNEASSPASDPKPAPTTAIMIRLPIESGVSPRADGSKTDPAYFLSGWPVMNTVSPGWTSL